MDTDMMSGFKAKLYFSPIALLDSTGQPPKKVMAIELDMARSGKCLFLFFLNEIYERYYMRHLPMRKE